MHYEHQKYNENITSDTLIRAMMHLEDGTGRQHNIIETPYYTKFVSEAFEIITQKRRSNKQDRNQSLVVIDKRTWPYTMYPDLHTASIHLVRA